MYGTSAYAQAPFASAGGNTFQVSVSESASALATFSSVPNYAVSFAASASSTDTTASSFLVQSNIAETASSQDTTTASFQIGTNVVETASSSDSFSAAASFLASTLNTASSTANFSSLPNYAVSVQEAASGNISTSATPTYAANVLLTASSADETVCTFAFLANVDETTDAADTLNTQLIYPNSVSEAAILVESPVSASANFAVSVVAHSLSTVSSFIATSNFACTVVETGASQDIFFGRFLWNDIDDTQIPGWTDILQPKIIEDIAVFGGSNFGVLAYTAELRQNYNPNPATWNPVQDQQVPNWTDIPTV
jgi:hypothetical protein